jgi:hypothetical protein
LVFYRWPDGRLVVIGEDSEGIRADLEEFQADLACGRAENLPFV